MEFRQHPPREYRGSTSNDVAIRFIGKRPDGTVDLQLNVLTPEMPDDDPPATERQLAAVADIFPHIPPTISSMQAHAILCYRDYARAVIDRVLPDVAASQQELWLVIIATLVSHDERIAKDVRRWSGDRFHNARSDPRVVNTKHFNDLILICRELGRAMDA